MHIDSIGNGEGSYKEARHLADCWNDDEQKKIWVVIVLTIMHLNHDISDNSDANLYSGCQRCHNRFDQNYRRKNASDTRNKKKGLQKLF